VSVVTDQTRYDLSIMLVAPDGAQSDGSLTLWVESGATDEGVLAVAAAIENAPWMPGTTAQVGVFRIDQVQTTSQRDSTVTPPAFV